MNLEKKLKKKKSRLTDPLFFGHVTGNKKKKKKKNLRLNRISDFLSFPDFFSPSLQV
jgi:hypothetical protein